MAHEIINGIDADQDALESVDVFLSDISVLQSDITSALSDVVILTSDVQSIASDVVVLNIAKALSDIIVLEGSVSDIYSDLSAMDSQISDIYSDISAHDTLLTTAASDITSIQSDIIIINTNLSDIQVELDTVSDLIASIVGTSNQVEVEYSDIAGANSVIIRFANPTKLGSAENIALGNYAAFAEDGTFSLSGDATVYKDIYTHITPRTTGTGKPTLAQFTGDIYKYTFAVNDVSELRANELPHDGAEGTPIEIHVHWATNGTDIDTRGVKWEISYTWANTTGETEPTLFQNATVVSKETSIPHDTADKTLFYTSVYEFTPTGWKVGSHLLMSIKRIASVTNPAPTLNPWCLAVGIHYKVDSIGSRTMLDK